MSEQDIIETQVIDNDEYPQIQYADTENPGIASFNPDDFVVGENGHISATQKSGIPQYLGKIVGSGQGASSLNWKLDSGSIKPTEQVKIGDCVMLTDAYLNFKPGDIFRITFVQVKGSVYTVKTSNTKLMSLGTIESGGGKLYMHKIFIMFKEFTGGGSINIYSTSSTPITKLPSYSYYIMVLTGPTISGVVRVDAISSTTHVDFYGVVSSSGGEAIAYFARPFTITDFSDSVTEL